MRNRWAPSSSSSSSSPSGKEGERQLVEEEGRQEEELSLGRVVNPSAEHGRQTRHGHGGLGEVFGAAVRTVTPGIWLPILGMIFGGCCSNVYTLEILVKDAPRSGHLITFAQFLVVSVEGLLYHLQVPAAQAPVLRAWDYVPRLRPRFIPIHRWLLLVMVFFISSILNNWALAYDISMPIHIIFRSGGLIVSIILGKLVLGKRYSARQMVAVVIITAGVMLATFSLSDPQLERTKTKGRGKVGDFTTGILLLSLAMFLSGWLGIIQEVTYRKYGKHWREGLFYTHAFSLPFFLIFRQEILEQIAVVANSRPVLLSDMLAPVLPAVALSALSRLDIRLPKLAVFLVLNVFTQYVCISGVHRLTSVTTALTVNLVLNVRKFASLVLSVWHFGNPFPFLMKVGSVLVFAGLVIYSISTPRASGTALPPHLNFVVPHSSHKSPKAKSR